MRAIRDWKRTESMGRGESALALSKWRRVCANLVDAVSQCRAVKLMIVPRRIGPNMFYSGTPVGCTYKVNCVLIVVVTFRAPKDNLVKIHAWCSGLKIAPLLQVSGRQHSRHVVTADSVEVGRAVISVSVIILLQQTCFCRSRNHLDFATTWRSRDANA